jgi:hypothetical protein
MAQAASLELLLLLLLLLLLVLLVVGLHCNHPCGGGGS